MSDGRAVCSGAIRLGTKVLPERDPIYRCKLSDEIFDRLTSMLISGELSPGELMPSERVLMERFGVGRPATREALQALEARGSVAIVHGERARVLEVTPHAIVCLLGSIAPIMFATSPRSIDQMLEARQIFECSIVRQAAELVDADGVLGITSFWIVRGRSWAMPNNSSTLTRAFMCTSRP